MASPVILRMFSRVAEFKYIGHPASLVHFVGINIKRQRYLHCQRISSCNYCDYSLGGKSLDEDTKKEDSPAIDMVGSAKQKEHGKEFAITSHLKRTEVTEKYLHLYKNISNVQLKPTPPSKSQTFGPYINDSETLQNLIKLGVDLSKVALNHETSNKLLKMNFETEVKPYLMFLHQSGVESNNFGVILTKNPQIFCEDLDHLQVRLNYFKSKQFPEEAIARIITLAPAVLSSDTREIDTRLGCLQQEFRLTGDEIRRVVTRYPKLVIHVRQKMRDMRFRLKELMGFTEGEMKQLLLGYPKIFFKGTTELEQRFDYIHHEMNLSHEHILMWPNILETRLKIIKQRHQFLKYVNRDQYDPKKPNFVSLKMLVSGQDDLFCTEVAKVPVSTYDMFLKTL